MHRQAISDKFCLFLDQSSFIGLTHVFEAKKAIYQLFPSHYDSKTEAVNKLRMLTFKEYQRRVNL